MNIETSAILPGGWHYKDESGYRVPHKGELPNAAEVVKALMHYRLENALPVGNPEADLEEYVCRAFPSWCRRGAKPPPPVHPTGQQRNVDIVSAWATRFYTQLGRIELAPINEASARAKICKDCPMQIEWARDCPPCVQNAQRLLTILRQGRDTEEGSRAYLNGCGCYGWDNRTAVHFEAKHLPTPEQINPSSPPQCWVRKL